MIISTLYVVATAAVYQFTIVHKRCQK